MADARCQVFIQARMSSSRFPGKVLAPFKGKPLIDHVIRGVIQALPEWPLMVVTSDEASDDPLAIYLRAYGLAVFRGPLDNVFERFRLALRYSPSEWVLRVNADSPLLDAGVLRAVGLHPGKDEADIITTIFPRSFPRGRNTELIRAAAFEAAGDGLTSEQREHVTPYFYNRPDRFRIVRVESGYPEWADVSLAVDTLDDLRRLESLDERQLQTWAYKPLSLDKAA